MKEQRSPEQQDLRSRWARFLTAGAVAVRADGWDPYRYVWSTGEVIGVALVLDDDRVLTDLDETEESALLRWAFDLYGLDGGEAERASDCRRTRDWFATLRTELGELDFPRPGRPAGLDR